MREDDLLHVVGHEEVVEAPALIPLHEGLLGPERATAGVRAQGRAAGDTGGGPLRAPGEGPAGRPRLPAREHVGLGLSLEDPTETPNWRC